MSNHKLKKYDEIKEIITNQLGFHTLDDYKKYLETLKDGPTPEQVALLSPDNVDCIDFWRVLDDLFSTDPVCNVSDPNNKQFWGAPKNHMDANRFNLKILEQMGGLYYVDEFNYTPHVAILEIGVGYGGLKNYIEATSKNQYYGYDLICRVPGVIQLSNVGTFLPGIENLYGTIQTIISSNVFQHLSEAQRIYYIAEAAKLLRPGGVLVFNGVIGTKYIYHFGQWTPMMHPDWIQKTLSDHGFQELVFTTRYDRVFQVVAQKI